MISSICIWEQYYFTSLCLLFIAASKLLLLRMSAHDGVALRHDIVTLRVDGFVAFITTTNLLCIVYVCACLLSHSCSLLFTNFLFYTIIHFMSRCKVAKLQALLASWLHELNKSVHIYNFMSKNARACNSLIPLYFYLRYQVKVERKASEKALRKSLTGSYTSVSVILC